MFYHGYSVAEYYYYTLESTNYPHPATLLRSKLWTKVYRRKCDLCCNLIRKFACFVHGSSPNFVVKFLVNVLNCWALFLSCRKLSSSFSCKKCWLLSTNFLIWLLCMRGTYSYRNLFMIFWNEMQFYVMWCVALCCKYDWSNNCIFLFIMLFLPVRFSTKLVYVLFDFFSFMFWVNHWHTQTQVVRTAL